MTEDEVRKLHHSTWHMLCGTVPGLEQHARMPVCLIKPSRSRAAGWANASGCEYNSSFFHEDDYHWTVVHELCHVAAHRLMPDCKGHGELWEYLYTIVCKAPRSRYHYYDVDLAKAQAKRLTKIERLQSKINKLAQDAS